MEAKDTVMGAEQKAEIYGRLLEETTGDFPAEMVDMFLEAQAEISFKAGKEEGWRLSEETRK